MRLDLRPRCIRERCAKLIRKGKMAQSNYTRYKPYCSYACQEWHNLEKAQQYLRNRRDELPDDEHEAGMDCQEMADRGY